MNLIRSLFWVALFVASTFCFIVVFEHGFTNFGENCRKEVIHLKRVFNITDGHPKVAP